ncbi:hypothetical protein HWV62_13164 [Athelia sp. TMB]|nr:hypothetical protein HWV62_13164 [Athelia sp. TMB]
MSSQNMVQWQSQSHNSNIGHSSSRKRPSDLTPGKPGTAKRKRMLETDKENNIPRPAVPGIGPSSRRTTVEEAPDEDTPAMPPSRPPSAYITTHARRAKTKPSDSLMDASDVWWFVRPIESEMKPDGNPHQLEDKDRSRKKPKCKYVACTMCELDEKWQTWKIDGAAASTIRAHLSKYHHQQWCDTVMNKALKGWRECTASSWTSNKAGGDSSESMPREPFTIEGFLARLVKWIVVDDQSINVVECPELCELLLYLNQDLLDADLPHRTKLTELIFEGFQCELEASKEDILTPRISPYRVHTGKNLAQYMFDILEELGLLNNLGYFTFDNASNMDTSMVEFEKLLVARGISFDAIGNCIRCFPHVKNVGLTDGISELTGEKLAIQAKTNPDDSDWWKALAEDPIAKCCKLMANCRASGQHRKDFDRTIIEGNTDGVFRDRNGNPIKLDQLQLLRDVDTRWSSIYLMIDRVLNMMPAINIFLNKTKHHTFAGCGLLPMDKEVLQDICEFIEVPHAVQEVLSGEGTLTLQSSSVV